MPCFTRTLNELGLVTGSEFNEQFKIIDFKRTVDLHSPTQLQTPSTITDL